MQKGQVIMSKNAKVKEKPDFSKFLNADKFEASNEKAAIKGILHSIITSMQAKKEEDENIKELLLTLKSNHDIPPKIARKVASIMFKGNLEEVHEDAELVDALYDRLSK